jgi:hypothetical protein
MIKYLVRKIKSFFTPVVKEVVVEVKVLRLTENEYAQLEKTLPNSLLGGTDTAETAAYKLGVQHALSKIRSGIVI